MDGRKRQVLRAVVEDYVATAEPVASRTVVNKYLPSVSSATVRNDMQDLEIEGYLTQPHVSAGRVPADKGYRFYVDELAAPVSPDPTEVRELWARISRHEGDLAWILREAAQLIAEATSCAAMAVVPGPDHLAVSQLRAVQVTDRLAVLLLVTDQEVMHRTVELPSGVAFPWVAETLAALSDRLRGLTLPSLGHEAAEAVLEAFASHPALGQMVLSLLEEGLTPGEARLITGGTTRLLRQPEFRDVDRVRAVLEFLDDAPTVEAVLGREPAGVQIRIGTEHGLPGLDHLSLVTASLTLGGAAPARVAVLGPSRMAYPRVAGLVGAVVRTLEERWAS
jgi:heat-inducible transcriptional repressor